MAVDTVQHLHLSNDVVDRFTTGQAYLEMVDHSDSNGRVPPLMAATLTIDAIVAHVLSETAAARVLEVARLLGIGPIGDAADVRALICAAFGGEGPMLHVAPR